jgi:hypothetical protein
MRCMKWKHISGYGERYAIYPDGRVLSFRTYRWLSAPLRGRYPAVRLCSPDGLEKSESVHLLVARAFLPVVEGKRFVNHMDGNKSNPALENLEWCTHAENISHAIRIGLRVNRGSPAVLAASSINRAKAHAKIRRFSQTDIDIIKRLRAAQYTQRQIGALYGCTQGAISRILTGDNYRWTAA